MSLLIVEALLPTGYQARIYSGFVFKCRAVTIKKVHTEKPHGPPSPPSGFSKPKLSNAIPQNKTVTRQENQTEVQPRISTRPTA
ncbi:hypothetical protein CDAR_108291 [Caerostris darwini]|uniref:Uncharacterized protein n=1 Tax=Caerostris darwini TaxID=1538125 RepID=A0AAV4TGQ7_9ARAC|nr:hypothetical protein CDAR_108291 [Caerostris darwini]